LIIALIILFILFPILLFLLVRRGQRLTPEEAALNYLNAVISGRTADAYNLLSAKDRAGESLKEYQARRSLGHGLIAGMIAGKVKIVVSDTVISDNEASVASSITIPDFEAMMNEALSGIAGEGFPDRNLDAFVFVCRNITHYLGKFGGEETPMKNDIEMIHLIREDDRWKIRIGE
jgi:hypothetical protein